MCICLLPPLMLVDHHIVTPQTIDAKFEKQLLRIVSLINEWNFSGPWQPVRSIRGHPFPLGRKICISAQICVPRNNLSQKLCSSALPKSTLFDPALFGRFNIQGGQICVIIDLCNNLSQKICIFALPKLTENTLCPIRNSFSASGAEHVCGTHKLGIYISFLSKCWISPNFEICCAT